MPLRFVISKSWFLMFVMELEGLLRTFRTSKEAKGFYLGPFRFLNGISTQYCGSPGFDPRRIVFKLQGLLSLFHVHLGF